MEFGSWLHLDGTAACGLGLTQGSHDAAQELVREGNPFDAAESKAVGMRLQPPGAMSRADEVIACAAGPRR